MDSASEKKQLQKDRLKLEKEVKQYKRKWTIIYTLSIGLEIILFGFSLYSGWWISSIVTVLGLCLFVWNLSLVNSSYKYQMEQIEMMKRIEDKIVDEIEQQEVLKKKINEMKAENKALEIKYGNE